MNMTSNQTYDRASRARRDVDVRAEDASLLGCLVGHSLVQITMILSRSIGAKQPIGRVSPWPWHYSIFVSRYVLCFCFCRYGTADSF